MISTETSNGEPQVDYTGYVGKQPILSFPKTGQDLVIDLSILLLAPTCQEVSLRSSSIQKLGNQLATGRMKNGPLNLQSIIMVQSPGYRIGLWGTVLPYVC
jgi:hypothetical protein